MGTLECALATGDRASLESVWRDHEYSKASGDELTAAFQS